MVTNYVYERVREKANVEAKIVYENDDFITTDGEVNYWWNVFLKTPSSVRHYKPEKVVWNKTDVNY